MQQYQTNSGVRSMNITELQDMRPDLVRNMPTYRTNSGVRALKITDLQDMSPELQHKLRTSAETRYDYTNPRGLVDPTLTGFSRNGYSNNMSEQMLHGGQIRDSLQKDNFMNQGYMPRIEDAQIPRNITRMRSLQGGALSAMMNRNTSITV